MVHMTTMRTFVLVFLLHSSTWTVSSSFLSPDGALRRKYWISSLQGKTKDDIIDAYERLGEKIFNNRDFEAPAKVLSSPPTISTPEPPVDLFDAAKASDATATSNPIIPSVDMDAVTSSLNDVADTTSQSVVNIVSETIRRAKESYQAASESLSDSPRLPGTVPNFLEYIRNSFSNVKVPAAPSIRLNTDFLSDNVQEKLSILRQNALKFFDIPTDPNFLHAPKGGAIVDFIHSDKFPWYLAVVLFVLSITQRQAGIEATRDDMNALVVDAESKAKEAADAANLAAQGAEQAMKITEEERAQKLAITAEKESLVAEVDKMAAEIKDLRLQLNERQIKASKLAADEAVIENLECEKSSLQTELKKSTDEIQNLRAQLTKNTENENSQATAAAAKIKSLEAEKAALQATVETTAAEIEKLRAQLEEYQSVSVSNTSAIKSLQEDKTALQAEVQRLTSQTEELRSQFEQQLAQFEQQRAAFALSAAELRESARANQVETPSAVIPAVDFGDKEDEEFAVSPPLLTLDEEDLVLAAPEPTPTPISMLDDEEVSPPAAAPATEQVEEVAPKKGAKKKAAKSTKKKEAAPVEASTKAKEEAPVEVLTETKEAAPDDADDWRLLSPTSLKRKSIKDLTVYLESKGVSTIDAEGKTLKKSDLIDAVLAL